MFYLVIFALFSGYADALPSEPYILYSNITNIHALDLTNLARSNVVKGLDRVVPLGFDSVGQHMYFGEHTLGRIYRSNYDGSSIKLIMEGVKQVEGIAIDWIGRNMYWTTYKSETIEVSTLDGKFRKVLINSGVEFPRGMAVDPISGYLFWSDWGAFAVIERCALDGSDRKLLVKDNITWPNGVTIDYSSRLVYWIDAKHDTISRIDYDGNNRKIIFEDKGLALSQFHGFDLDITGDDIYFTDWLWNGIYGVRVTTGKIFRSISIPTTRFIKGAMGLRIIESSRQKSGSSNCGNNNGGCEQLCFHKVSGGVSCACQLGMKLKDDGKTCEDAFKDEFIMFAEANGGKIYQMQLDSVNVRPIAVPFDKNTNISRPVALEYDKVEDRVYWTDVTLKIICRAFRNGTGFEVLFNNFGVADGLTIDFAARQLYWTSTTNDTIETSRLDGSFRRTITKSDLDEPRDIIVDPIDGYMYWTDWGRYPKIERAFMNGENRTYLVTSGLHWPNGLTIDHIYNKLYWADAHEDSIEAIDLTTKERKIILNKKIYILFYWFPAATEVRHPFGLTSLNDRLYWTDWQTKAVYRADVTTGANVVKMAGNLGKPMDIHAYSSIPKSYIRIHYTFSFPNSGSNFTCISSKTCPAMDPAPQCPPGFIHARENATCGLYCRDVVGYSRRCPCKDWMSCAIKERYVRGCSHRKYTHFRVRECKQVVKPGRCPYDLSQGSQKACVNDTDCPSKEKCCQFKCRTPATIETHPCHTNNGGCDQLCFGVPGGHKCGCENGYVYNDTCETCVQRNVSARMVVCTSPRPGTEDCNTKTCYYGAICKIVNQKANCSCDLSCSKIYSPVCGSDGTTYDNECRMREAFCNKNQNITTYYTGKCANCSTTNCTYGAICKVIANQPVCSCNRSCTDSFTPVCGSDGTTYDNECKMREAFCKEKKNIGVHYNEKCADCNTTNCAYGAICKVIANQPVCSCNQSCNDSFTPVCGSDGTTYDNECKMREAFCKEKKNIGVHHNGKCGDCSNVNCKYGATCEVVGNVAKCECDLKCADSRTRVCGSDGKTYDYRCKLLKAQCTEQRPIQVIKNKTCGCDDDLNMSEDYKNASKITCRSDTQESVKCEVSCNEGHNAVFPQFLELQCYKKKWIRKNTASKYVPINAVSPPRCYKTTPRDNTPCATGSTLMTGRVCVPCPPGSYDNQKTKQCTPCDVTMYQNEAGKTSCKKCEGDKTSTTTGAESCYFNHASNAVEMVIEPKTSAKVTEDVIRKDISNGLTKTCETVKCSFNNPSRRRRRESKNYVFKEEHIIILSLEQENKVNSNKMKVQLFVLDPTSTSLIPDKALSSEHLKALILQMQKGGQLPGYTLSSVGEVRPAGKQPGSGSGSKAPVIAGVIVAMLVVIGLVFATWLVVKRRRRNKSSQVPPVQFNPTNDNMQIGHPSAVSNHENPEAIRDGIHHGFVNQVYNDVHAPPPYYETSPIREPAGYMVPPKNVYETPNGQAGALPEKEQLPDGAVVDILPPKEVGFTDEKPLKADPPMKFFHKRSSQNVYEFPDTPPQYRSRAPDAEAELKLERPPKFDDVRLQMMREKTASSILPNVPRKKKVGSLDTNANQATGSQLSAHVYENVDDDTKKQSETSAYQNVGDVTKEQSES